MPLALRLRSRKHALRQLDVILNPAKRHIIRKAQRATKTLLEIATAGTPKWSGQATESWRISFDSSFVPNHAINAEDFKVKGNLGEPEFAEGLQDPEARQFNERVVSEIMAGVNAEISARVKLGVPFTINLVNDSAQSDIWLGNAAGIDPYEFLREVNHDFYTYQDIYARFKSQMKGVF